MPVKLLIEPPWKEKACMHTCIEPILLPLLVLLPHHHEPQQHPHHHKQPHHQRQTRVSWGGALGGHGGPLGGPWGLLGSPRGVGTGARFGPKTGPNRRCGLVNSRRWSLLQCVLQRHIFDVTKHIVKVTKVAGLLGHVTKHIVKVTKVAGYLNSRRLALLQCVLQLARVNSRRWSLLHGVL